MNTEKPKSVIDVINAREIREAQLILERYKYSFLAKKLGKIADTLEMSEPDDDAR